MVIDAVLFDLDDTLVNHRGAAAQAVKQMVSRFSAPGRSESELLVAWSASEGVHMAEYLNGECSFDEQRRRRLRDFFPLLGLQTTLDDVEMDAWFTANYLSDYEAAWRSFPDARGCIRRLGGSTRSVMTGVITNGDPDQQRSKLIRVGLLPWIGPVLTPAELGFAKPHPSSFLEACHRLEVSPHRTVFVGDSLSVDARGATSAGLVGVWLDRGNDDDSGETTSQLSDGLPVYRISSLTELPDLVGSLSV
jgi:putative hydrolase of the HAD superfamily